jgi:DNA-binding SARP family transcriptional activator
MDAKATRRVVRLLGGLAVEPAVRLSVPARRLLVFLAVEAGPVQRWLVAGRLWPDQLDAQSRASLRRAVWQLPRSWIAVEGDTLWLNAIVDLEHARSVADRALSGQALTIAEIHLLSRDVLPGWNDEWLVPAQDEFHHNRIQALESACRVLARHGEPQLATQAGMLAVNAEPLRESAVEALVMAHLAEGNRYEAVRTYRQLARLLDAELGVQPGQALTDRLHRLGLENGHPPHARRM